MFCLLERINLKGLRKMSKMVEYSVFNNFGPVDRLRGLVFIAPARIAGDPGSNPGPGENFLS